MTIRFKTLSISELLNLSGSGAKAPIYLGNTFLKKKNFSQAAIFYGQAVRAIFNRTILTDKPDWLEDTLPGKSYILNHTYKFIYCPIPKAACSSLKKIMVLLSDLDHKQGIINLPQDLLHSYVDHTLTLFAHNDRESAAKLLGNDEYFKFAIVRNPWDRLTSAYLNKFVEPFSLQDSRSAAKEVVKNIYRKNNLEPDYKKSVSFRQFLEYLSETEDKYLDGHWRSQHLFLGEARFDFIGHFENLNEDFKFIKEKLGIALDLPWSNKSDRTENLLTSKKINHGNDYSNYSPFELKQLEKYPNYHEFYTPDLFELVWFEISERYQDVWL